ncbi:DUF3188 domain-containing protein [Enterococcus sp. LJL90]
MIKNGLFLCSIGLLLFLYSINPANLVYNLGLLAFALILIIAGVCVFMKGRKNDLKREKDNQWKSKES